MINIGNPFSESKNLQLKIDILPSNYYRQMECNNIFSLLFYIFTLLTKDLQALIRQSGTLRRDKVQIRE